MSKKKVKDSDFKNKLDRKQSNKKIRQAGFDHCIMVCAFCCNTVNDGHETWCPEFKVSTPGTFTTT